MKDFNEFKTLFAEQYSEELAQIAYNTAKAELDNTAENNLSVALAGVLSKIQVVTLFKVLEAYHEWVSSQ
ncbi:hypothetical protein Q2T46_11560 [Thermoanaerobacterium sp. CMT5567-10]|uniref:hypothetical protein n=1 Tax=Thermoanaerobacterium sp. CMT5567-10 TaxID=3061989 RepID=UPI0026DFBF4B|nr:hypothetical protein [Thermoanaerobacterium sp. CMT5567-10]WKV08163.1 hypothetical protein Q2T46_11560 [Thermoanaerobacterium sp. CMT5567-10]